MFNGQEQIRVTVVCMLEFFRLSLSPAPEKVTTDDVTHKAVRYSPNVQLAEI